ncbi:hypothetical protein G5V59_19595 [Nocardioides sp. W3-2-3]|uniref:hypothetical protein n=1 Tax=Nocardioides convexus TaxID=2712224 RepID=UPI002418890A|nr:hypothetical protein [Nocardioides convexus]NHA01310.1 hypothetical protein [Nocardioides convexus]
MEDSSTLTRQRCDHAVQWNFTALGGKARVTHLFLVFDTQPHAKAAEASLEDKDFDLRAGSLFKDFKQGKWKHSVYGNVVAVTIGTTNATVPEKDLKSLVDYMNTDYRVALRLQGPLSARPAEGKRRGRKSRSRRRRLGSPAAARAACHAPSPLVIPWK